MFKISEQRKQTHEKPHKHKNDFLFFNYCNSSLPFSFLPNYLCFRKKGNNDSSWGDLEQINRSGNGMTVAVSEGRIIEWGLVSGHFLRTGVMKLWKTKYSFVFIEHATNNLLGKLQLLSFIRFREAAGISCQLKYDW